MERSFVFSPVRLPWRRAALWTVALLFVLWVGGVAVSEEAEKKKKGAELSADLSIENLLKPDPYIYDPSGKRDPFRSLTESRSWEVTTKAGLERFDLTELRLKGIVIGELGSFAMIEAPDNLTYFVSIDDTIGMSNGKIVQVGETSVTVEEPYTDDFGNPAVRRVVLALEQTD